MAGYMNMSRCSMKIPEAVEFEAGRVVPSLPTKPPSCLLHPNRCSRLWTVSRILVAVEDAFWEVEPTIHGVIIGVSRICELNAGTTNLLHFFPSFAIPSESV